MKYRSCVLLLDENRISRWADETISQLSKIARDGILILDISPLAHWHIVSLIRQSVFK